MSSSEEVINNMTDNAIYEPLQKDVEAVKNAISALTNQVSDALNTFAGTAEKQARRGYKQARSNVDAAVSDFTKRGGAALDAAHEAANTLEESLEDAIQQRPLATIGSRQARFSSAWHRRCGQSHHPQEAPALGTQGIFRGTSTLPGRHGGVRNCLLLGP